MADKAFITPEVLKWARESARMPLEVACSKLNVPIEKLQSWEQGESLPTMVQAEKAAQLYRRPFAVLFLPKIPRDFTLLHDFRAKSAAPLGTAAVFIMREIQQKQQWLRELYEENEEEILPFVGRFNQNASPEQVAADILRTLDIDPTRYKSTYPLREWIRLVEAQRICVSRISFIHSRMKLDSEEFQGFVIADNLAPFIFINSDDYDAPQLFTLVHELAHIWIAKSGVTEVYSPGLKAKAQLDHTELFCNEVAANALMPTQAIAAVRSQLASYEAITRLATRFGVSTLALLVRSLNLGLISQPTYKSYKAQAEAAFRDYERRQAQLREQQKREKKGGPSYHTLQLSKNGRLFTQIVIDAFNGGAIASTQASTLLNTQVNKFSIYENMLSK